MSKKILIITGGPLRKLESFREPVKKLGIDAQLASFYDLEFVAGSQHKNFELKVRGKEISEFDLIYIRVVGKRLEGASLLVSHAKEKGIRIVDKIYENARLMPSTISKLGEMRLLFRQGINVPETYFGSLKNIRINGSHLLEFPFIIKGTQGRRAKDVWLVKNRQNLENLTKELRSREITGESFFAQKLIQASQRIRVLVIGNKAVGAITRPTKWRKRWVEKIDGKIAEGRKEVIYPIPDRYKNLALRAAKAAKLEICGVDILEEDKSGKLYVIEANAAPAWNLIKKDTGVEVEEEILSYLGAL